MSRRRFVAGNWKMNGSLAENENLLKGLVEKQFDESVEIVVFPPALYVGQAVELTQGSNISVGVQNISQYEKGAYTGEISISMAKDMGATYVLIGHSERRELFGESDEMVAEKFKKVIEAGLVPVLCVGESEEEREKGETNAVISRQIKSVVELVGIKAFKEAIIAYEPIWAIGTGKAATPEMANEVHNHIRWTLSEYDGSISPLVRIVYGGSVTGDTANALFKEEEIDGALVGGASLKVDDFTKIILSEN